MRQCMFAMVAVRVVLQLQPCITSKYTCIQGQASGLHARPSHFSKNDIQ